MNNESHENAIDLMGIISTLDLDTEPKQIAFRFYDELNAAGYSDDDISEATSKFYELLRVTEFPNETIEEVSAALEDLLH